MNGTSIVVGVLLGAVVGIGAGFMLWSDAEMPLSGPLHPAARLPDRETLGAATTTDGGQTGALPRTIETAPYGGSVQALIEGAAIPEATSGNGTVSGRVTLEDGRPLAGAVVRITAVDPRPYQGRTRRGDPAPERDLASRVRRYIETEQERIAREQEVITGEDGRFEAAGLAGESFTLAAWAEGFEVRTDPPGGSRVRTGAEVRFVAVPVVRIPVSVLLPSGGRPQRATIRFDANRRQEQEVWEPHRPEIRLTPGLYALWAEAGDASEYKSGTDSVMVDAGKVAQEVVFKLEARTGVKGRVVLPPGFRPGDNDHCVVFYARTGPGQTMDEKRLRGEGQQSWTSPWNGYEFKLFDLAAGTWMIGAGDGQGPLWVVESVEVTAGGIIERDIVVPAVPDAKGIHVSVLAPDGTPVADARVSLARLRGRQVFDTGGSTRRLPDGRFFVVLPDKQETQAESSMMILATSARYGRVEQPLPAPGVPEVVIRFVEPASLQVAVSGYTGSDFENRVAVRLDPERTAPSKDPVFYGSGNEDSRLGPGGEVTIAPVQPGRYQILLQLSLERWSAMPIHQEPIVIGPGTNTVTIPMPLLHGLTVRVPAGNSSKNLSLNRRDVGESGTPVWRNAVTNEDGVATFEGLPAGTYAITSHTQDGQKSMRVQVPANGTVLFEPGTPKALAVRWKADDEYPASVGLRRNDVVVGIEGRDFDGTKSATVILQGMLMAQVECRLAVERDGRRFEITVDTAKFAKATQHGHLLEPIER